MKNSGSGLGMRLRCNLIGHTPSILTLFWLLSNIHVQDIYALYTPDGAVNHAQLALLFRHLVTRFHYSMNYRGSLLKLKVQ